MISLLLVETYRTNRRTDNGTLVKTTKKFPCLQVISNPNIKIYFKYFFLELLRASVLNLSHYVTCGESFKIFCFIISFLLYKFHHTLFSFARVLAFEIKIE